MKFFNFMNRIISFILIFSITLSLTACSDKEAKAELTDPNPKIIVENIETENIETENIETESIETETILTECITEEIYLKELVVAEDEISELLLEEDTIDEVLLCKTIYVPQDNIDEFAEHSQTAGLFGDSTDIGAVFKKIAVGTGVILTIAIVKKAGLPKPIASAVVAAADKSLKFGAGGTAIGSLFGGLTGATDELDPSGRASAVIGFARATAGLILSALSLVAEIPSGGSTTITAAAGIKLVIAGISTIAASGTTAYAGYKAVKAFTATDAADIDWDNIDWEKLGVSSVQKAIQNGADGYMWGAIIGAIYGGAEGYDFYQKYNTPYTKYNARLMQTPKEGSGGHWSGARGESDYILDEPILLKDGTKITKVSYKNAVPDFSPYQKGQVNIPEMTNKRYGNNGNFRQADKALSKYWTKIKYNGKTWTIEDVELYRTSNNLTWHEMSNMESMQLVPSEVNQQFTHYGGVAEYNAMLGQEGVGYYD